MRVLIVEDDPKIAGFLTQGLESEGYSVTRAGDGETALELALDQRFDLVLLDLMLPRLGGLEVLRRLREHHSTTRVIAVTARSSVADRVQGLDLGADDYLVKPFSFVELMARVRSLFRRTSQPLSRTLSVGELEIDRLERTVRRGERLAPLSLRELQLLELFMRHVGEPLTRATIADRVWGYQFDTGTNVIDVYVNYVRKKLRELGLEPIRTLRGIGYILERDGCGLSAPDPRPA